MEDGYDDVFVRCKQINNNKYENDYTDFREREEFGFLVNNNPLPDQEA
jgi:hypothetical protein